MAKETLAGLGKLEEHMKTSIVETLNVRRL